MGKSKKIKVQKQGSLGIMGKDWKYILYNQVNFLKMHPECEDSGALTLSDKREMHFIVEEITIGTIRHEVRHAFCSELCLESAIIDAAQYEEIQCTLDENRWDDMNEAATKIYEDLILSS